ncbi:MAG: Transcriptional regulator, TetR family [Hydrocarboniphaga sp.]|uniref:TetR/AcrR family transcriptional regulator n=1 Tax=Hydrocarboniphaga sp. TaxID=2033016 RepID=UPI002623E6B6|nr:TetR/AcrR family transcriptional regulator [Hydrocarboniphaga sp.]MDB5970878.1 Transcriptional regulator, TetR family [Hydrocarboniphaga sp.]
MGTRERRQRELGNREQLILETARELIRSEGLLNLQMARIAEKCEYAVGTLYQHFASKEDLLLELTRQDVVEHAELIERLARWRAPPRERIFGIAVADMLFVRRSPDHFRMSQYAFCEVVWTAASAARRQSVLDAEAPIAAIAVGIVNDAVAAGSLDLRGMPAEQVCLGLWALVVGMHNLVHTEGVMHPFAVPDPYRLMCRHLQSLLNGQGWQPYFDVSDDAALDALIQRIFTEVFDEQCCEV